MADFRCNACGGLFTSPQAGVPYFHTCPPLSTAEIIAGVDKGTIQASAQVQADVAAAKLTASADPATAAAAQAALARLNALTMARPGAVDQNITDTRPQPVDAPPKAAKAEGAGVTKL